MKKTRAFTLAEVLTTLMLIGIVAAFTIPVFISEFNKNKWTVTFKRTFAETFNALSTVALDEDCAKSLTCTNIFNATQDANDEVFGRNSTKQFGDAMTKTMKVSINCKMGDSSDTKGCFDHNVRLGFASSDEESLQQTMSNDIPDGGLSPFYTFVTNRGVSYALFSFGLNCLNNPEYASVNEQYINAYVDRPNDIDNQMLHLCGFIIIDVNGKKKPNVWGRDVFGMWVTDKNVLGLYPFGGENDKKLNSNNGHCGDNDARGCAADIIKNGWSMKY